MRMKYVVFALCVIGAGQVMHAGLGGGTTKPPPPLGRKMTHLALGFKQVVRARASV